MPRDKPPFRADHVGSLLRPAALLDARERFAAGQISAGPQSATDGEFRRAYWHMDFIYLVDTLRR
jgi:5-methyltetrahydropteroyltriglutamate--homocysteine methyltransferase